MHLLTTKRVKVGCQRQYWHPCRTNKDWGDRILSIALFPLLLISPETLGVVLISIPIPHNRSFCLVRLAGNKRVSLLV
ncbi:hypothetical protein HZ326_18435 [Fusarium oxysporum f. sp. albedinis]|nr:hypothetical protein HZ326_18435 [Fusarium oxysporum f. sp. albedinis]